MKKCVASMCLCLMASFAGADVLDYKWGNVSLNHIAYTDNSQSEDFSYVEIEGGFGSGDIHFYGFYDFNDNDSTFYKINPTFFFTNSMFVNYTQKGFKDTDADLGVTDQYFGIGNKFSVLDGFISTSVNLRKTDNEFVDKEGNNGIAVLTALSIPVNQRVAVDGWFDYSLFQRRKFGSEDTDFRGNIGVRYTHTNGLFARVAYAWVQADDVMRDVDSGVHFSFGYYL